MWKQQSLNLRQNFYLWYAIYSNASVNYVSNFPKIFQERHGVVFLQRFTLDRAYGQDVEISIPKSKDKKKKASSSSTAPNDPNHPMNVETRRQTKMAAHVSMEVVKLLRSGNLRVNLMRTAQGAMSKLKLPIKKAKNAAKKSSSASKKNKKDKGKGKHE